MDTKAIWGFIVIVAAVLIGLFLWKKFEAYAAKKETGGS